MSIQLRGNGGTIAEVDATTRALIAEPRPLAPTQGAFGFSVQTGVMAAGLAAGSEILHLRWTHATRLCVVESVRLSAGGIVAFAPGFVAFDVAFARTWTADGTGGATATTTGNNGKKRSSFGTSSVGTLRIATTAVLGAGTKVVDTQGMGSCGGSVDAVAGSPLITPTAELVGVSHPIVLATNEGIVIRATVPATGTWQARIDVHWTERDAY